MSISLTNRVAVTIVNKSYYRNMILKDNNYVYIICLDNKHS